MSLIEKAAERFEKERNARARGRTPTPNRDLPGEQEAKDGRTEDTAAPAPPVAPPQQGGPAPGQASSAAAASEPSAYV